MIFKRIVFSLLLTTGITACASFGARNTPTPTEPTPTPAPPTPTPPPSADVVNGEYITIAAFEAELAQVTPGESPVVCAAIGEVRAAPSFTVRGLDGELCVDATLARRPNQTSSPGWMR